MKKSLVIVLVLAIALTSLAAVRLGNLTLENKSGQVVYMEVVQGTQLYFFEVPAGTREDPFLMEKTLPFGTYKVTSWLKDSACLPEVKEYEQKAIYKFVFLPCDFPAKSWENPFKKVAFQY